LFKTHLEATTLDWTSNKPAKDSFRCYAKTRYRQQEQACLVAVIGEDRCKVTFDEPQRAITPGQSVVFYLAEQCLGGGVIEMAYNR
ncbi:MAG: tRNA 2-thiouridine(34) synthase MnmA, partial [Gammaproteobacteria bacterium]